MPEPTVRVYDPATNTLVTIPARELATGMVPVTAEGVAGEFWIDPRLFRSRLVRHPPLPPEVRAHLARLSEVFRDVFPQTPEEWEDGFRRDEAPAREIALWLRLADAFEHFGAGRDLTPEQRRHLFAVVFAAANRAAVGLRFVLPVTGELSLVQVEEVVRWLAERDGEAGGGRPE